MRAVWLEDQCLSLRDVPDAHRHGEVTVKVVLAGICNTDIELTRGYYPFTGIPGHEFVGVAGGRRVVGEINAACGGKCEACRAGRRTHCELRSVLGIRNRNGAFAEYLTLPPENLYEVPDSISDEEAVFIEPLAAALEIQEQVKITPDDRVLIVGYGKLGRLIAQTLNCTIYRRGDPLPAQKFDVAIECTGDPAGFEIARNALRPRGTLVMKSTYAGDVNVNMSSLVVDEITLVGSRCGPFEKAIALLASRQVNVASLVDAAYSLDDAIAAFRHARQPRAMKVLIRIGQ